MHQKYLLGYPEQIQQQAAQLIADNALADYLTNKYPIAHNIRTDKALYQYVTELKRSALPNEDAVNKVIFDNKIQVIQHALGLHTFVSRVQGNKLKSKHEIRVATLFKDVPLEFLRMIAVHELAHLKEKEHNKSFYKLCTHMEPSYHQIELDLRLYLTQMALFGGNLWGAECGEKCGAKTISG